MKQTAGWMKLVLGAVLIAAIAGFAASARAADLPLAAASPLAGVAFDDRPLLLPVQRNFQMAMLTAGSELGRSCGRMEAYGWRMGQTEQARVNQIFNNTVDRLRLLGYSIAPQVLNSVSKDITLFTADKADKHFIFLWSAGELGLVLNLCETSAPLPSASLPMPVSPSVQVFPVPTDVVPAHLDAAGKRTAKEVGGFSPVGKWVGGYTCAQGYTGGTIQISHLHGQDFDGVFSFYPTTKNMTVPDGSYSVYGQYDQDSKRILINPGKWIKRPPHYYNTVIVGGFDAVNDSFSAYFQGINGCTSFEAKRVGEQISFDHESKKKPKKTTHIKKKPAVKKPPAAAQAVAPAATAAPAPLASPEAPVSSATPEPVIPVGSAAMAAQVSSAVPVAPAVAAPTPIVVPPAPIVTSAPVPVTPALPASDSGIMVAAPSSAPAMPPAK